MSVVPAVAPVPSATGWTAVAVPAVPTVPMSTTSASSHLSVVRMHSPLVRTDARRNLAERSGSHQGRPAVRARAAQHRIQPEATDPRPTEPFTRTQRCPAWTVTGPAWCA